MSDSAWVRVPATSANLGPGYDCAGLALAYYDELEATVISGGLAIDVHGEGSDSVPRDASHLVVRSIARAFEARGRPMPGLHLVCRNQIPHGRGLGSSSAAIVGGLVLGRALLGMTDEEMSKAELLALATELEGHPDNVAPAILGGFTVAWQDTQTGVGRAVSLQPSGLLQPVVAIAQTSLATEHARELIPAMVPHRTAASNSGRAALLTAALTDRVDVLFEATEDQLHQQARRFAYPESYSLVRALRSEGVSAVISGAGPTVLALGVKDSDHDAGAIEALMHEILASDEDKAAFRVLAVGIDLEGARVESDVRK